MTEAARQRAASAAALVVLASLLPALSCGGDSGGTGSVAPPGACLSFAPAADPAPGTVTAREGGSTTCDRLDFDLIVTDVDDIFGAEFSLAFDPAVLSYSGHDESGSILASDGTDIVVFENAQSGLVQLTITRLRASSGGIDAAGSQLLIRLQFQREADSGFSTLVFSGERIWNGTVPPEEIPGIEWHGGTLTVR